VILVALSHCSGVPVPDFQDGVDLIEFDIAGTFFAFGAIRVEITERLIRWTEPRQKATRAKKTTLSANITFLVAWVISTIVRPGPPGGASIA